VGSDRLDAMRKFLRRSRRHFRTSVLDAGQLDAKVWSRQRVQTLSDVCSLTGHDGEGSQGLEAIDDCTAPASRAAAAVLLTLARPLGAAGPLLPTTLTPVSRTRASAPPPTVAGTTPTQSTTTTLPPGSLAFLHDEGEQPAAARVACPAGCDARGTCFEPLGRCDCPPDRRGEACSLPALPACTLLDGTVLPCTQPISCACLMECYDLVGAVCQPRGHDQPSSG
jgi:hypothetical protein